MWRRRVHIRAVFGWFLWLLLSVHLLGAQSAVETGPWDDHGPIEYREAPSERIEAFKNNPDYRYDKDGERPGWFSRLLSMLIQMLFQQVEQNHWFRYVLLGLLVLAFAFFILRLLNVPLVSFISFSRPNRADEMFDGMPADLSSDTVLEDMLALYRSNGAYREAVRILYLIYLKRLDQKGVIRLREFKTNREYAREIRDVLLRDKFSSLVKVYDYVWFGQFNPKEEQYRKIELAFLSQSSDSRF